MERQALSEKDDEQNEHQDERRAAAEVDVDATSFEVLEVLRLLFTCSESRALGFARTIIPTASSLRETLLVGLRLLVVR
jgi:hypothetical protein